MTQRIPLLFIINVLWTEMNVRFHFGFEQKILYIERGQRGIDISLLKVFHVTMEKHTKQGSSTVYG